MAVRERKRADAAADEVEAYQPPAPDEPQAFFNRELSWLSFARRVLALIEDHQLPLLERVKFAGIMGKLAADQWWRQMPDGYGSDTALGLCRFARITDDERIDHRQRAGDNFGKTFRGERDRLARQPFQRAVRAHVNERVDIGDVL